MRYVLAAAELGGFRRAARRLGVQQSAVSRRIQELEERLGARIFERCPHGVALTQAGREFVEGAQGAIAELDRVVDVVADVGRAEQGVLRIGVVGGLGPGPLDQLLRRALLRDPGIALELVEGDAAAHGERLAHGRLDVAFLAAPGEPASAPAWRERILLALPDVHALAACSSVRWDQLAGERLLVPSDLAVVGLAARRMKRGRPICWRPQSAGSAGVARLVALGQGLGVLAEPNAMPIAGVVYRPIFREFLAIRAVVGRGPSKPALRRLIALLEGAATA